MSIGALLAELDDAEIGEVVEAMPPDLRLRVMAEMCRESFALFVRQSWPYAGTTEPLTWGWHLDAICDHLQAVAEGKIRRLLINIPPAHGKSKIVSVIFPAWLWARDPSNQLLCASYAASLAERDSVFCRELVESDWYRALFQTDWALKADQNAKSYWANTAQGHRVSIGVGGTGQRCTGAIVDDPVDIEKSMSKAERDSANHWIGHTLPTRFNDAERGWIVMIMQRLHEEDPAGFVLGGGNWQHLNLPSEFESDRRCVTKSLDGVEFWRDPRNKDGELLFPAKFPPSVLEDLKKPNALGAMGFAAQHQQRPAPAGGDMFRVAWWRFHKPDGKAPDQSTSRPRGCFAGQARPIPTSFDRVILSLDANFKNKAGADPISLGIWGTKGADRFLLYRVAGPLGFTRTVDAIRSACALYPEATKKIIEDAANGPAIVETLQHEISGIVPVPPRGGKESRAAAIQAEVEAGNVYLPDGAPWLDEFIGQFAAFPRGKHDDDVDMTSQALIELHTKKSLASRWAEVEQ